MLLLRYAATNQSAYTHFQLFPLNGKTALSEATHPKLILFTIRFATQVDPVKRQQYLQQLIQAASDTWTVIALPGVPVQFALAADITVKPGASWPSPGFPLIAEMVAHK